jgi:hypothetical protein
MNELMYSGGHPNESDDLYGSSNMKYMTLGGGREKT